MHKRKDLIVLFFSLAFAGLLLLHLYYEIRHSILLQSLVSLVLPQARQLKVECGDITFSTSYIQIDKLRIHLSDDFQATVDKLSLNYSPVNVLTYYLRLSDPEFSLHVESPHLIFYQSSRDTIPSQPDPQLIKKMQAWSGFWFEGDIFLNQAKISLFSADRKQLLNCWEFESWIHSVKRPFIQSEINLYSPFQSNLKVELNTKNHRLTCQSDLTSPFPVQQFMKGLMPENYSLNGNITKMHWQVDFPIRTWPVWNGVIECAPGVRLLMAQADILADSLRLIIQDNKISIPPINCRYLDHSLIGSLVLPDLYHPQQMEVQILSYHHPVLTTKWVNPEFKGSLSLELTKSKLIGQGSIEMLINGLRLTYQLDGYYEGNTRRLQVEIENISTTRFPLMAGGFAILGTTKSLDFKLASSGILDILKGIPNWLKELSYSINGQIIGSWNNPVLDIQINARHPYLEQINLGELSLTLKGPYNNLKLNVDNNSNFRLNGTLQIENDFTLQPDLQIYLNNYLFPIKLDNIGYPQVNGVFNLTRNGLYRLEGDFSLNTPGDLNAAGHGVFEFSKSLDTLSARVGSDYFHFKHENFSWDMKLHRVGDSLNFLCRLDSSEFEWQMNRKDYHGVITINYLPFRKIYSIWSRVSFLNGVDGTTHGQLKVNQENQHFKLSGQCELLDASYQFARDLYLRTFIQYFQKKLSFHQVELSTPTTILAKSDSVIISPDTLQGEVAGQGIDAYYAPLAFAWLRNRVKGNLSYTMSIGGTYKRPYIEWNVQAINGDFWFMYFDVIRLRIIYQNFTLTFPKMSLEKENHYQLNGNGLVYHVFGRRKDLPENLNFNFKFSFDMTGNLLSLVPRLLPENFHQAEGQGNASLVFSGKGDSLWFDKFSAEISQGNLYPTLLTEEVRDVKCKMTLNPETRFFSLEYLSGKINNMEVFIYNTDSLNQADKLIRELPPFYFLVGNSPNYLGYFWIRSDWVSINIPGIMPNYEKCEIRLGPSGSLPDFLVAGTYPYAHVVGNLYGKNLEFFYPPVYDEPVTDTTILDIMHYNISMIANQNVWFRNNVAQIRIEDKSQLSLVGQLIDSGFILNGAIVFPEGKITYMGKNFDLQNSSLEFSGKDILTTVTGKAVHQYYDPALSKEMVLEIKPYFVDPVSHQPVNRGRIEDIRWKLSSDRWLQMIDGDQLSDNQILSEQFGPQDNYREYATQLVFNSVNTYFVQQYLQFLESRIKHNLPFVDFLRINPGVFNNLTSTNNGTQQLSYWTLLSNSRVTLGKYITNRLFATYTGTFLSHELQYNSGNSLDMRHSFSVEFRLYKTLVLNYSYYYDSETREKDRRLQVSWHYFLPY